MALAVLTAHHTESHAPYHDAYDNGTRAAEAGRQRGAAEQAERSSGRQAEEEATVDPEARLRAAAAAGDRAAFAMLYSSYRGTVLQYLARRCRGDRHLAEDLTQDTFTRALGRLGRYRETGRPFSAWLLTIAANLLADYWRSSWHRRHVTWSDFTGDSSQGWLVLGESFDSDPAIEVAATDQRQQLAHTLGRAVARLTDRQRQVVSLRYAKGLSVADTAHALGLDEGAVKAATYRARRALACDPTVEELR